MHIGYWWESKKERDHWEVQDIGRWTMLKWILEKQEPYAPAGRPSPPGRFMVLISVRGCVDPRDTVRLEGLGQLKNPMTSSGIDPVTFQLVA
jgi:hypothetical protein